MMTHEERYSQARMDANDKRFNDAQNNGWIKKVLDTDAKSGRAKAIERGRGIAMSLSLGREFGETMESFQARKPEVAEFYQFWKRFAA